MFTTREIKLIMALLTILKHLFSGRAKRAPSPYAWPDVLSVLRLCNDLVNDLEGNGFTLTPDQRDFYDSHHALEACVRQIPYEQVMKEYMEYVADDRLPSQKAQDEKWKKVLEEQWRS